MDLTEKWFYTEREQDRIRLFLLDIHKPIHHANIAFEHVLGWLPRLKSLMMG